MKMIAALAGVAALLVGGAPAVADNGPSDPEIAHIAYTAGLLDIEAGKLALAKSHNAAVREFAHQMVRDHAAVNGQALALVKKLGVTPQSNPTSVALAKQAAATRAKLAALKGRAFDRAYVANEVAFHKTVNGALKSTLIPAADNAELKRLLEAGLTLFSEHQAHGEQLARRM